MFIQVTPTKGWPSTICFLWRPEWLFRKAAINIIAEQSHTLHTTLPSIPSIQCNTTHPPTTTLQSILPQRYTIHRCFLFPFICYFLFHFSFVTHIQFFCVFSHVSCTQCHLSCVVFQISCFILHVSCIIFQKEIHISHILLLIVSLEESSPEEIVPLPGKSRSHRGYKSQVSQELPLFIFDGRDLYKICHHNCFKHTKKVPLVENLWVFEAGLVAYYDTWLM